MDYDFDSKQSVTSSRAESMGSEVFRSTHTHETTGLWGRFMYSVRGFWQTRETDDTTENKELLVKTTLRELVVYILYLVILVVLAFGSYNGNNYYFTQSLSNIFYTGSFDGIGSISDYWNYLLTNLPQNLYWSTFYNGVELPPDDINYIAYENKLLGVPRLRQIKVRGDSCVIASNFREDIKECYAPYSDSAQDIQPFGFGNSSAWVYNTLGSLRVSGFLSTYPAGGFYVDLNATSNATIETLNYLYNNYWTTRGTRMSMVEFTVYNPNINLFGVVKLMVEIPPSGGAMPYSDFRTVKLLRYVSPMDYFVLACECIFVLFMIYYTIEEYIEIRRHKLAYFSSFYNVLDIVVVIIGYVCIGMNLYRTVAVNKKMDEMLSNENGYQDFDFVSYCQLVFDQTVAILLFISWVKLFKYISFNQTMNQLSFTLEKCAKDLAGFAIMFCIVFFAFAQLGNLLFGKQISDYRDFYITLITLFRVILGDFDFPTLMSAQPLLGPIYFISYVFFVFFVLMNMFLAIINDTYSQVKEELANKEDEYAIGNFFKQRANLLMDKLHLKREKIVDIQDALDMGDANGDNKIDFDEWRAQLKKKGYADAEIEAVFSKYDTDGDRVLEKSEQDKMQAELEAQKADINEEITNTESALNAVVNVEQVHQLTTKINDMEDYIGQLTEKMNSLLGKLETMTDRRSQTAKKDNRSHEHTTAAATTTTTTGQTGFEVMTKSDSDSWNIMSSSTSPMPTSTTSSRISLGKKKSEMDLGAKQL